MAEFLVTGGDGFIGSHIVETLLGQGAKVRVMDNLVARGGVNLDHLKKIATGTLTTTIGDIRDRKACQAAVQGVDYVFHEAALGSVPRSVDDPATTHEVNATGTLNLLLAAREAEVKRFVWASSSSVYGDPAPPDAPKAESLCPAPLSPYAASKAMGEAYASLFYQLYGLPTVSLRYFNVFGPRQDPEGDYAAVIPRFISLMLKGQQPTIYGDGRQSRDFTYVANIVASNLAALKAPAAPGRVINIANGESYNLLGLVEHLNQILGTDLKPRLAPARAGDVRHSKAAVGLATELLDFTAEIDFKAGLALTVPSFS